MRTSKSINEILGRLMETGGMSEAQEADFAAIRDEFTERDNYLRQVADPWDDEADTAEIVIRAANGDTAKVEELTGRYTELEGKYNDLVKRYTAKFFAGGATHEEDAAADKPEENTVDTPAAETVTVNDLFEEVK